MESNPITIPRGNNALIVFVKAPRPGEVKTRLLPVLSDEEAASLYCAFLQDVLALAATLADVQCVVAYPPGREAGKELRKLLAEYRDLDYVEQCGENLGERMAEAFREAHHQGWKRAVLIGSDSPTLPRRFIEEAFDALTRSDVVLGPCTDGGYYLVGMREPQAGIFRSVEWGTASVLKQTMANILALSLRLHVLPLWYDVDTPADLHFLQGHLAWLESLGEPVPAATTAWLRSLVPGRPPQTKIRSLPQ